MSLSHRIETQSPDPSFTTIPEHPTEWYYRGYLFELLYQLNCAFTNSHRAEGTHQGEEEEEVDIEDDSINGSLNDHEDDDRNSIPTPQFIRDALLNVFVDGKWKTFVILLSACGGPVTTTRKILLPLMAIMT